MKKIAIATVLSACIAAPAFAGNGYVGINAGQNKVADSGGSALKASTAFGLFGGYSFNDYIAAEASYTNLGTADTDPASAITVTGNLISLSAVGSLPLSHSFSLFAKVGYGQSKLEAAAVSFSETNSGVVYGAGAQFNIGQKVGIRLAYDKFKVGSTDPVDSALKSVGVLIKF